MILGNREKEIAFHLAVTEIGRKYADKIPDPIESYFRIGEDVLYFDRNKQLYSDAWCELTAVFDRMNN